MKTLALIGKAKSGKDSLARILASNRLVFPMGLADLMKRAVLEKYGFADSSVFGSNKAKELGDIRLIKPPFDIYKFRPSVSAPEWVKRNLDTQELWEFDSEPGMQILPGVLQVVEDQRTTNYCKAGDTSVALSPREIMQKTAEEMESEFPSILTDAVIQNVLNLLISETATEEGFYYTRSYDRKLGLYDWKSFAKKEAVVVITDVRKPHQIQALKGGVEGVTSIKINRNLTLSGSSSTHSSETSVDSISDNECDLVIENNSSYEDYKNSVLTSVESLLK